MAELDDQLRRLAASRADAVPPLDPEVALLRARQHARRRATWIGIMAACIAALLVTGAFTLVADSEDRPTVHTPAATTDRTAPTTAPSATASTTMAPTTTVPFVAPPTCGPLTGADALPKEGSEAERAALETPLVVQVQLQTDACVDSMRIGVHPTAPAWSARYESSVDGAIRLVLSFPRAMIIEHAQLPSELGAGAPSSIKSVHRLEGPDAGVTWTIDLAEELPFRVLAGENSIDVEFASTRVQRSITCGVADQHFEYVAPDGWVVAAAPGRCTYFAPEPYLTCSACDGPFPFGTIGVSPSPPLASSPEVETVVSSSSTTVAGRAATVTEVAATGAGLFLADYRTYRYSVDWEPEGTLVFSIGGMPGSDFDARKVGLDAIAATVRYIG